MQLDHKTLPPMRLAYIRHTGAYGRGGGIAIVWKRLIAWCGANPQLLASWQTYGIGHDNPGTTPPEQCRYDCCVELKDGALPDGDVTVQAFAGGSYACARVTASSNTIAGLWQQMFRDWLPAAGLQPLSPESLELYPEDFKVDEVTGVFSCWLCVPAKAG